jgi:hypothetical protein
MTDETNRWQTMDLFPEDDMVEDGVSPEPVVSVDYGTESVDAVQPVSEPVSEPVVEPDPEPVIVLDPVPVAPREALEDEEPVPPDMLKRWATALKRRTPDIFTHQQAVEMLENDPELMEEFKNLRTWH